MRLPLSFSLALSLTLLPGADLPAQARLGTLSFPTSGSAAAQPDFVRGVLYLHSFEYDDAATAFQAAQTKDPAFVMAYWGEAMTHTHAIWNEQDLPAARAALGKLGATPEARAAKAATPRERAWLHAVEVLYGEGSKPRRDTLYAEAMKQVLAAYPDDEARLFYALAVMGLNQGVRDVPAYMRAGAIALDVFERQPDHPGAAHYVIHAFDDPTHAPLGLKAARAYAKIAPGAAHAQHMTTHIFLALGMWPEVISQNVIASGPDRSRWQAGHYTYWLHYGLLQAGRTADAVALLDELKAHAGPAPSRMRATHLASARAHQVIDAERWDDPALTWDLGTMAWPSATALDRFTQGYAALKRGDRARANAEMTALDRELRDSDNALARLIGQELRAVLLRADGRKPDAEALLRTIAADFAALPVDFGPPDFVKPPMELLGEWLLEDGRPAEAKVAFANALAAMPGRVLSLRGLQHAAGRSGP